MVFDDKVGREMARFAGLSVIGTLGILLLAREQGIIVDLKDVVDGLKASGFRISDELYQRILGE